MRGALRTSYSMQMQPPMVKKVLASEFSRYIKKYAKGHKLLNFKIVSGYDGQDFVMHRKTAILQFDSFKKPRIVKQKINIAPLVMAATL